MRRKAILFAILPLTNALSLANFQPISSIFIPINCQLTYDSQIPTCQVSDFNNGCSSACQSALTSIASDVNAACSDVSVSSSTLLGIVMNGGIIQALCPTTAKTTSTMAKPSSIIVKSSSAVNSVTIPTTSPGVVVATTPSTSKATKSTPSTQSASTTQSVPAETTISKTTETSESTASSAAASSTTPVPNSTADSQSTQTTSTSTTKNGATSNTKTKATAATTKSGPDSGGSGGGSPFDISSGGNRIERGSMFAFVVASWGCLLMVR